MRSSSPSHRSVRFVLGLLMVILVAPIAAPQEHSESGLSRFVLSNGLELFVYENHVVPLAKIQIVFRCGAFTQTPRNAGLFHLYEHMLFKGNEVYRTEADFQAAMKELGVSSWNGGTSNEQVAYYFTVPSEKVGGGIAFWANAIRYPLFDSKQLETEKKVVINEIRGYLNNPDDIFESGMDRRLYAKYPWRRDVSGSEANIEHATVAMMRDIQNRYYIPNNAALFVGGDVDPQRIHAMAEEYFGSWQRGADPALDKIPPHPAPPDNVFLNFPDEQMYRGVARVTARFRGPDVLRDSSATYAADVWGKFMDDPNGRFRDDLMSKVPGLYNKDYIWAFYFTQRDGGYIEFTTYLVLDPNNSTYGRIKELLAAVRNEFRSMVEDPGYFAAKDFEILKVKLGDEKLIEQETANGFISNLSFWWASASTDYYMGYLDNLNKVNREAVVDFLRRYLIDANAVVGVRVNPEDSNAADARAQGFEELDRSNAFWWNGGSAGGAR